MKVMVKVKLSVHAVKAYRRSSGIAPLILNLGTSGGERSASSPGRMTPRKEQWHPLNRRPVGPQSWSGRFEEKKNLLFLAVFEPRTV